MFESSKQAHGPIETLSQPPSAVAFFCCNAVGAVLRVRRCCRSVSCGRRRGGPVVPTLDSATKGDAGHKPRQNTNVTLQRRGQREIAYNTAVIAFCGYNAGAPHPGILRLWLPVIDIARPWTDRPSLGLLLESIPRPRCGRLTRRQNGRNPARPLCLRSACTSDDGAYCCAEWSHHDRRLHLAPMSHAAGATKTGDCNRLRATTTTDEKPRCALHK